MAKLCSRCKCDLPDDSALFWDFGDEEVYCQECWEWVSFWPEEA